MSAVRVADSIADDQLAGYRSGSVIQADMPDRRMDEAECEADCERVMLQFLRTHGALAWMNSSLWRVRFFRA